MSKNNERLFIGSRQFAAALDAKTGAEIWRTTFPAGASVMVTMLFKSERLYMGYSDRAYCLDADTGAILWTNALRALDDEPVRLAMEGAADRVSKGAVATITPGEVDDGAAVAAYGH